MISLRENLPLKIASLILAVGVWFYVRGEDKPVQIISVPLELQNLSDDLAIAGQVAQTVSVRVRAPEVVLRALDDEAPLARADLAALVAGEQFVRIAPSSVVVPPGAEVLRISPEYITLRLEKKVKKNVPVSIKIAGEPASGFVLDGATVEPERVTLEGPESAIKEAHGVETDLVRLDGRAQPFDRVVKLFPARTGVRLVAETSAVVSVNIHERYVSRELTDVPVELIGVTSGITLEPASLKIILEGPPGVINAMDPNAIAAVLNTGDEPIGRRGLQLTPRVVFRVTDLEGQVFVKSISPEQVKVSKDSVPRN